MDKNELKGQAFDDALTALESAESTYGHLISYLSYCIHQEQKGAADPAKIEDMRRQRKVLHDKRHDLILDDVDHNKAVVAELGPQVRAIYAKSTD